MDKAEGNFEEQIDTRFSRRSFLLAAGIAGAVLVAQAGVKNVFAQGLQEERPVGFLDKIIDWADKEKLDETERKFEDRYVQISPRINQYVESEEMRKLIVDIFAVFKANKNSGRNKFRYELDPYLEDCEGSFNGLYGTIKIPQNFDSSDPKHFTTLFHEIGHVPYDEKRKASMTEEQYRAYWSAPKAKVNFVVVPEEEAMLTAVQIELLNVMMEGALKNAVLAGQKVKMPETKDKDGWDYLTRCAEIYYKNSGAEFIKFIKREYSSAPGALIVR